MYVKSFGYIYGVYMVQQQTPTRGKGSERPRAPVLVVVLKLMKARLVYLSRAFDLI